MDKTDIKADMECMTTCVAALEKLARHYNKTVYSGESVAEKQAEQARIRCLNWVVNYIEHHKSI